MLFDPRHQASDGGMNGVLLAQFANVYRPIKIIALNLALG
jgi:hypothetical protein